MPTMANKPRSRTYDVLAVSSTVHKANADYLAGILRYASDRPDWNLWLFNPMADISYGNVLPTRRASGVIVNVLDEVPLETLRPRNRRACVVICDGATVPEDSSVLCDNAAVANTSTCARRHIGLKISPFSKSCGKGLVRMIRAYDENYLVHSTRALGWMLDSAVNLFGQKADAFWRIFISTGYAGRFGKGESRLRHCFQDRPGAPRPGAGHP